MMEPLSLFLISAILIGAAAILGWWKAKKSIDYLGITDNVISELIKDGYVINAKNEDGEEVLVQIHPKYFEMLILWEKNLAETEDKINRSYE